MINQVINGVVDALYNAFSTTYPIYKENVNQGLDEPSFSVFTTKPTEKLFRGSRYFKHVPIVVNFFPSDDSNNTCYSMIEQLYTILEYITVGTSPDTAVLRGINMEGTISDGVVVFTVDYDFFVIRVNNESDPITSYEERIEVG